MIQTCPVCGSHSFKEVLNFSGVPQYNLNYSKTREEALNMHLESVDFVQCLDCTFVFNRTYSQLDYQVHYDADRSNSATFRTYLSNVAIKLNENLPETIKNIIEIGAGDCHFAEEFLKLRKVEYHAFDPSWTEGGQRDTLHKYNSYYDESCEIKPDVLVIRHVLEHMSEVYSFMKAISYEQPKYILLEVPCFEFVNANNHYHYYSYEHCSYFTKEALIVLMHKLGYKEVFVDYIFGEEYLLSLWEKDSIEEMNDAHLKKDGIIEVKNDNRESFQEWFKRLNEAITEGAVIWGAGGKGVMMSNLLKLDYKKISFIIDLNPNLWGMYIPGSGIEVQSPEVLKTIQPSKILIMNHLYKKEIERIVMELGLSIPVIPLFD